MGRAHPPKCRMVLDLIASGRKVTDVARDLRVSGQDHLQPAEQYLIDRGRAARVEEPRAGGAEGAQAPDAALEAELAATRRANEPLKGAVPPKVVRGPS